MSDEASANVVVLKPRRREAPALFVDLHLGDDFSIELRLHDSTGVVGTLEYSLTAKSPDDFDLDELRANWARWRGSSSVIR
jgi:hypothetical protein